jgi:hypothetical protein
MVWCLSFVISVLLFIITTYFKNSENSIVKIPTNSRLPRVRAGASRIIKSKIVSVVSLPQSRQSAKLFLQSLELGLPHSLTRKRVCLPPLLPVGRGTIACGRGVGDWGGSQLRRGDIHCDTLMYLCTL